MKQKKKKPKEASFVRKDKYQIKEGVVDLHSLKLSELKERAKDLQVDIGNVDKRNSSEIRKTIWDQSNLLESDFGEKLVSVDDDEYGKKIWKSIIGKLPFFALFQSDRSSNDGGSEIQNPNKVAIGQASK